MEDRFVPGFTGHMNTTQNTPGKQAIAVIGGTGHTGRRVVGRLRDRGVDVRVGSRSGSPAFHWERPETWSDLLRGCTAAYVAYTPDVAAPGAAETLGALAERAREHGLERLVLLSGRGEVEAEKAEDAVRAAGVPTAVIRSSVFAQNFSEHFLLDAVLGGTIAFPAADVAEPFLDLDDLAEVAELLLTAPSPSEETLELTGPRAVTFAEAAADLSAALGRPVTYVPVTVEEFVEGAVAAGVPREEAETLGAVFGQIFDGRNAHATDTVERVLGRPASDFTAYVARAAAAGAWSRGDTGDTAAEPAS